MAEEIWYEAEVIRIIDETPNTKRFWFKLHGLSDFVFKPGQFISFDLPIHEKKSKRIRSYSIASAPDGTNIFELVIVLVEDGLGTPYMWKNFIVGAKVPCRGPLGRFNLPEEIDRDICFICTGTGIAPFRSMIHHLNRHKPPYNSIYLIFGCRTQQDILYREELTELARTMPNIHYIYTCSRENPETFDGRVGYVHQVYEEIFSDKRPAHFYLCGWRNMLNEARTRLQVLGYDKSSINIEIYG